MAEMQEPLSISMRKIARGTGVAIVGTLAAMLVGFIIRLIIARYGSGAEYGIYSLVIVIFAFATTIVSLGLNQGATRYIAFFRSKGDTARVGGVISASLILAAAASIIGAVALFLGAGAIATSIFHTPALASALKIFAVAIPFFTLINIGVAVFRGFDSMGQQTGFQYILFNLLFLAFILVVTLLNMTFAAVFYSYLAASIITAIALVLYSVKKLPQKFTFAAGTDTAAVRKELLLFSLPLMGTALLSTMMFWVDSLLLGYFKTPEAVGLYNAARPMAQIIGEPMSAVLLIYVPVATGLYARNLMAEFRRNYTILTKWVVSLTLPIFLVLFLFPEAVLNLLFGTGYTAAAPALRILSLGLIINNFFGPRGGALVALGHAKFLLWSIAAAVTFDVILNIILIPPMGIVGAAIAATAALTLSCVISTTKVYLSSRAQPLSRNLLKPVLFSIAAAFLFYFIFSRLTITLWMLPLLFILYYAVYAAAVVLTRSFDKEDIAMLLEIEKLSGVNFTAAKRILSRFI